MIPEPSLLKSKEHEKCEQRTTLSLFFDEISKKSNSKQL